MTKRYLRTPDAAAYLGVGQSTLERKRGEGNGPKFRRLGGKIITYCVDDLDAWWRHIISLDLPARFKVQEPKEPAVQPWGLRVAYLIDPCGVLWHVAQRRADSAQD